ncbi:MAG: alpha-L-fucosidase [Isosphaeraceae bacterium]|nr:alpha-L-fucosidase [Isosphaeraceae bacterium]
MRRPFFLPILLSLTLFCAPDALPLRAAESPNADARRRFEDAKFGLFLHWGVYALLGKGEWVMERDKLPVAEYEKLPPRFNPAEFDAEALVKAAKAAGARYVTFTAKHHDGFCMFDSRLTRYDVMDATPYARDPLKALADACRKHELTLFVYYSLLDWHHPDYDPRGETGRALGREGKGNWKQYIAYCQGQLRELCTQYGPIGGVWLDGTWDRPDADWDLEATYRLIHTLQPGGLVGNNHHRRPLPGEDFQVFEQDFPGENKAGYRNAAVEPGLPLETCLTMNGSWGYNTADKRWKTREQLIRSLVAAAGRGANLLLNVGLRPDGALGPEPIERLQAVGEWLQTHGESVYGTRRGPVPPQPWGVSTARAADGMPVAFLHVLDPGAPVQVPQSLVAFTPRLFGRTEPLSVDQSKRRLVIDLPEKDRSGIDTVIVLGPKVLPR